MNTTGRAKGPGPHRTSCEGNPKARSGAASPQGFTVRCFWVAARDLPCRVHRQTKGGFVRSGPADPRKGQTRQPQPFRQTLLSPASARGSRHCLPKPPLHASQRRVGSHEAATSSSPSSAMRYGKGLGQMRKLAPTGGQGSPPSKRKLSARASRGLARPDSHRRPSRSPRPSQVFVHKGQYQAA